MRQRGGDAVPGRGSLNLAVVELLVGVGIAPRRDDPVAWTIRVDHPLPADNLTTRPCATTTAV